MNKIFLSRISILLIWMGFLLSISIASNHFFGCRYSLGCQPFIQTPEEWFLGVPVAYYGVISYLILLFSLALRIWGSSDQRKWGLLIGLYTSCISAAVNFGLLGKLIGEKKPLCVACLCSVVIYSALVYLHTKLLNQKQNHISEKNESFLFFFIAFCVIGGYIIQNRIVTYQSKFIKPLPLVKVMPKMDRFRGNIESKVSVIAFVDLYCWHCRESLKQLEKIYNTSSNLAYGVRYFPKKDRDTQSLSMQLSLLSLFVAEQGKYWEFLDRVLIQKEQDIDTPKELIQLNQKYGVNETNYNDTIQSLKYNQILKEDLSLANHLNLSYVPIYFIYLDGKFSQIATANNLKKVLSKKPFKGWVTVK